MKRIKSVLNLVLIVVLMLVFAPKVNAASASIRVSSNQSKVIVGGTFTTTVTISSGSPIAAWEFSLNYDSSKVTLVSGTPSVLESASNTNKYSASYTYTFKAKASGSTNISVKNYRVADWNETSMGVSAGTSNVRVITQAEYEASLSKDCNLKSLSIDGATLSPEFNSNTTEYSIELEPGITKINIKAEKSDSKSSVNGIGEKEVSEGLNTFDITVTAENGSSKTYKLNVTVKELSPINVKIDNKNYTVVRKRENLIAPQNYSEVDVKIGEEDVPGYSSDITKLTLVGLKDEDGNIKLYIYDRKKNTYKTYNELSFSKIVLYQMDFDEDEIPANFKKTKIKIGDAEYTVYKYDVDSKYSIMYGMNTETGKKHIYMYDEVESTLQIFNNELYETMINDTTYYKNLLFCAVGASGILILVIILMVIKLIKSKKNKQKLDKLEKMIEEKQKRYESKRQKGK